MKTQISIPVPCHENWDNMNPVDKGRFCASCVTSVIDFTQMNDSEISSYVHENKGKRICGRFRNEQLEPLQLQIPESFLMKKMPFHRSFFFAALVVMGSTFFSCIGHHDEVMGDFEVVEDSIPAVKDSVPVEDSIRFGHTLGMVITPIPKVADTASADPNHSKAPVEKANPDKK